MVEATTKLLALVSKVGEGPWEVSPGLTESALMDWMGEQEDRADALKDRIERKQEELARLEEVEEERPDLGQAPPSFETAFRLNASRDISAIEDRRRSRGFH